MNVLSHRGLKDGQIIRRPASEVDVLITGADQRQGLAVIRALGAQGVRVFASGPKVNSLGFHSRFASGCAVYPSPLTDKPGFVSCMLELVRTFNIPVLFPVVESTVIATDEFREAFQGLTRLAVADSSSLRLALDKKETLTLANQLGIPTPQTCLPSSQDEALSFAETVGYPVVLKPRGHRLFKGIREKFSFKVTYARTRADLNHHLEQFEERSFPILQQYCPGVKNQLGVLCSGGELLGIYQWKGEREYPLTGGVTCLHLSVPVDPELKLWSQQLMRAMKWDGLAGVEYRVDETVGKKVLMEVNGRVWASISGALKLGLNFPYSYYRLVKEGVREMMPSEYALGQRTRYLRGDLVAVLRYWQGRTPEYLDPLPSRMKALWNFIKDFGPGAKSEIMDSRDPLPGLFEVLSMLKDNSVEIPAFYLRKLRQKSH